MMDFILKDVYLSAGIGLMIVSFLGIFWIIRTFRKKQEIESALPDHFADFFTPSVPSASSAPPAAAQRAPGPVIRQAAAPSQIQMPMPAPAFNAPPATPAPAVAMPVAAPAAVSASQLNLEQLASQLEKIEGQLQAITQKLERAASQPAAAQPPASKQDAAQISELSAKIEKIYQVLASLSGSAR